MLVLHNALIINAGRSFVGSVCIEGQFITHVIEGEIDLDRLQKADRVIDLKGKLLLPGVIDDQVHFRDPGLTHKADLQSESMAAIAGGVTSFLDMPNTNPQTVDEISLLNKRDRAADVSYANYGFYLGATNANIDEIKKIDANLLCGIKVFMGSSTGNMLVDNQTMLERIFQELPYVITTHCEKEDIIKKNIAYYTQLYGDDLPIQYHPLIRSAEACYASSAEAVALAHKYNTRLHLLHLSTEKELTLLEDKPLSDKRVTGEVCVHHLWFNDGDYTKYGNKIKWNPAIKKESDRAALVQAIRTNLIDVVATDHAPHLLSEKQGSCLKAASGGPLVQYSLLTMLELAQKESISLPQIVQKMCHASADLFQIDRRGYIQEGFYADLVVVDPNEKTTVNKESILSRCAWSPLEGFTFSNQIAMTLVNGSVVYENGAINTNRRAMALNYNRL